MSKSSPPRYPAKVVEIIDASRVAINRGSKDGIQNGQRFLVYSLGKELFDPETEESLGKLEIVRGVGVAAHVQERLTTIESEARGPRIRRVRRSEGLLLFSGRGEEVIEETGQRLPFDSPEVGDLVKPM